MGSNDFNNVGFDPSNPFSMMLGMTQFAQQQELSKVQTFTAKLAAAKMVMADTDLGFDENEKSDTRESVKRALKEIF